MKFEYSARSRSHIVVAIGAIILFIAGLLLFDDLTFFIFWSIMFLPVCCIPWKSVISGQKWQLEINDGYLAWVSPSGPKTTGRIKLNEINCLRIQCGDGLIVSLTDINNKSISLPQNCFHDLKNIVSELENEGVKIINC
jgi:hypothetical protein